MQVSGSHSLWRWFVWLVLIGVPVAGAERPSKLLSQYSHSVWTQVQGLPQDSARQVVQSQDGALWIGTDEGLARFDGFEFQLFSKGEGQLPSPSVTALAAASDGSIWIGTAVGLTRYHKGVFKTYTVQNGLPDNGIASLSDDHAGGLWIAAGLWLSHFRDGKFTNFKLDDAMPGGAVRSVEAESADSVWVAGYGAVGRFRNNHFERIVEGGEFDGQVALSLSRTRAGDLLLSGTSGLYVLSPDGKRRRYTSSDGLPDTLVRAAMEDHHGYLWVGTNSGLARITDHGVETLNDDALRPHDWVWSILEDRESCVWVGTNSGLHRFCDEPLTVYTKHEGLPGDQPTAVAQDRRGRIWVGFHDNGLGYYEKDVFKRFTDLPSQEVFTIAETQDGDLLVGTRAGASRVHGNHLITYTPTDALNRHGVFAVLEDERQRVLMGTNSGVLRIDKNMRSPAESLIPGGTLFSDAVVALALDAKSGFWAGTYGHGLWHWTEHGTHRYTLAEGLPSDQIRSVDVDPDGTLWIGTFGAGLVVRRQDKFYHFDSSSGLPSDNVSYIIDDQHGSLWLATTRGLALVPKADLLRAIRAPGSALRIRLFGVGEGLKTAQCAPGYPTAGGGVRTNDNRLWFPTAYGLAVTRPEELQQRPSPPQAVMAEMVVDGRRINLSSDIVLPPSSQRIEFHYSALRLSAPESIRFQYLLEGLDKNWIDAGRRRVADYNSLRYGRYRFHIRALDASGSAIGRESSVDFYREPHIYETWWFYAFLVLSVAGLAWMLYQWRMQQIRHGFTLVLAERARLAREIHDTLAQGFVGISSQLDAVAMLLPRDPERATRILDLARKMTQYSLKEARRSVMDLRAEALVDRNLPEALESTVKMMTAGRSVQAHVEFAGVMPPLAKDAEQQVLRIAQEAVANALKHSGAAEVRVRLEGSPQQLNLTVADNGQGFAHENAFQSAGGHFGLLGMRERAGQIGGHLELVSEPGHGTKVSLSVPIQ